MADTHLKIEPSILYFGTPVVLVSTCNEDETANIAPISSVFWLGWRSVLGISSASKTAQNMIRTGECVINIPSVRQVAEVDRLALLTGANLIPASKVARGYRYEAKKFEVAGLTPVESEMVAPPRAMECPVQMEAVVSARHVLGEDVLGENVLGEDDPWKGASLLFEMRILRIYAAPDIVMPGVPNRIDPDKWRPLIMSFQKFYGLEKGQLHESRLAGIPEALYRSPDADRAKWPGASS